MTSLYVLIYYFSVFKFFFQFPANIKTVAAKMFVFYQSRFGLWGENHEIIVALKRYALYSTRIVTRSGSFSRCALLKMAFSTESFQSC